MKILVTTLILCLLSLPGFAQTCKTSTGAVFTAANDPQLGKTMKDPSGLVWSEIARYQAGNLVAFMDQETASGYCKQLGGRLPTDMELAKLSTYLGAGSTAGYKAQCLNDLTRAWIRSSSSQIITNENGQSEYFVVFDGNDGHLDLVKSYNTYAVRCVSGVSK